MSGAGDGAAGSAADVGVVGALAVHPVKSLAARPVREVEVTGAGLAGDRAWTVVDAGTGERVSAKSAPQLAGVVPTGDPAADGGTLTELLGRPVRLADAGAPQVSVAAVHLVSAAAIRRAAAGEVPEGCSAEDPRANVVLDLVPGADERGWVGRRVRLGEVELAVSRTPRHCLGVYAEVRTPGRVRVGDRVELLP